MENLKSSDGEKSTQQSSLLDNRIYFGVDVVGKNSAFLDLSPHSNVYQATKYIHAGSNQIKNPVTVEVLSDKQIDMNISMFEYLLRNKPQNVVQVYSIKKPIDLDKNYVIKQHIRNTLMFHRELIMVDKSISESQKASDVMKLFGECVCGQIQLENAKLFLPYISPYNLVVCEDGDKKIGKISTTLVDPTSIKDSRKSKDLLLFCSPEDRDYFSKHKQFKPPTAAGNDYSIVINWIHLIIGGWSLAEIDLKKDDDFNIEEIIKNIWKKSNRLKLRKIISQSAYREYCNSIMLSLKKLTKHNPENRAPLKVLFYNFLFWDEQKQIRFLRKSTEFLFKKSNDNDLYNDKYNEVADIDENKNLKEALKEILELNNSTVTKALRSFRNEFEHINELGNTVSRKQKRYDSETYGLRLMEDYPRLLLALHNYLIKFSDQEIFRKYY